MGQSQDKHCNGCGWTGNTNKNVCPNPSCLGDLDDD